MGSVTFNKDVTSTLNLVTTGQGETKDTFMEEVETFMMFQIANFIANYWFYIIIPIGLVGNTLSFIVMTQPNNRKMSTCIYMAAISINDNIMMCVCFHIFLINVIKTHKWQTMECELNAFFALFALQNGTFLIQGMTIDKYIAIKWPHRAATHSTPRRAKIIAVSLYVCAVSYNIPHFFLSSVVGGQCQAYAIKSVITSAYSWFSFVLNAIIPFTLLIYMNFVIVKTVRNSHRMFGNDDATTGMETRQKTMKSAENQVTIMLLLVTTLFLILLCPTYFRFIYLVFARRDTPFEYAKSLLIFQITSRLYMTNSGINFFLYCTSGQKFRNDLKAILCCFGKSHPSGRQDGSQSNDVSTNSTRSPSSLTSNVS